MKEGRLPKTEFRMPLSRLESLPVELLQSIFLYSFNVGLPLASPYIALALSIQHVYTKLVLMAFSGIGLDFEDAPLHPDLTGASLQTTVMSRRWFNLDLMRRCQVIFAEEMLERERSNPAWETISVESTEGSWGSQGFHQTSKRTYMLRRDYSYKQIEIHPGALETLVCVRGTYPSTLYRFPLCMARSWAEQAETVLLPEKLLHGPWTDEKLDLLEMLCRAGATVDWVNTSAGEIADQGLKDAIMEGNLRAVKLLTRASPTRDAEIERQNVRVRIDTRHVRLAVLEAGCDLDIVEALVNHPRSTIDQNDEQIVAWAVKHRETKGRMVLGILDKKLLRRC